MPFLSHPLRSLRLALALVVVCGLSFVGYRVSASETYGSWLVRLKNAPAAVWAAMLQANPETVSQNSVALDSNRARSAAQGSIGLASALPAALRSREALLPAASAPLTPVMTSCASPSFGTTTNFGVGTTPYSVAIGDVNGNGKPDLAVANINSNDVSVQHHQQLKLFTTATTDLVVDVLGYYSSEASGANGTGLLFTPLTRPVRLLETRANPPNLPGCFKPNAPLNGQQVYTQAARGLCDSLTIPAAALAVVGYATVVFPVSVGYLTLWPSSAAQLTVATSNYNPGDVGNRHFIVGLGNADGAFKIYTHATSHLVID